MPASAGMRPANKSPLDRDDIWLIRRGFPLAWISDSSFVLGLEASRAIVWVRRYRETGSVAPGKIGGYKPNILGGAHGD